MWPNGQFHAWSNDAEGLSHWERNRKGSTLTSLDGVLKAWTKAHPKFFTVSEILNRVTLLLTIKGVCVIFQDQKFIANSVFETTHCFYSTKQHKNETLTVLQTRMSVWWPMAALISKVEMKNKRQNCFSPMQQTSASLLIIFHFKGLA